MATVTENYNLVKPDGTDNIDISVLNDNFDTIDAQMKENEDMASAGGSVATETSAGIVKPDGTTTLVDQDGTIHSKIVRSFISLSANWTQNGDRYTQAVSISGIEINKDSKVDIQLTETALAVLIASGVTALWIRNDDGVLTACAYGSAPSTAIVLPCTISSTISELVSIAVTTNPTTTTYDLNDTLDLTGIVVTATYADGSTSNVTNGCLYNPADGTMLSVSGTTDVGVTYTENDVTKTTSFEITVE